MKNILFVISTLRLAGAEKSLVSLLKALDPEKVNIDLFVFENGGVLEQEIPEYVHIIPSDAVTCGMTLELRKYLPGLIRSGYFSAAGDRIRISRNAKKGSSEFSWDIIKKHIPKQKEKYDVAIGYLEDFSDMYVIDKVDADKKIGWIHTDYTAIKLHERQRAYFNQFDEIATISDICMKAAIEKMPEVKDKIHIVENIVLPEDILKKAEDVNVLAEISNDWDRNKVQLVSVGRLEYQKGMDIAAEAAKVLADRGIDYQWHVFGTGSIEHEIKDCIEKWNLEDKFLLEGLKKNPYPYMDAADIIIQPSRVEGKSIVLDEAKILGKPIVATSYSSVFDQLTDGVTGIITGMEPASIADGICKLIDDKELAKTLSDNCRNEENASIKALNKFYELIGE